MYPTHVCIEIDTLTMQVEKLSKLSPTCCGDMEPIRHQKLGPQPLIEVRPKTNVMPTTTLHRREIIDLCTCLASSCDSYEIISNVVVACRTFWWMMERLFRIVTKFKTQVLYKQNY